MLGGRGEPAGGRSLFFSLFPSVFHIELFLNKLRRKDRASPGRRWVGRTRSLCERGARGAGQPRQSLARPEAKHVCERQTQPRAVSTAAFDQTRVLISALRACCPVPLQRSASGGPLCPSSSCVLMVFSLGAGRLRGEGRGCTR